MAYTSDEQKAALDLALVALADPTRRTLLNLLRRGPRSVQELAGKLPVSRPAVSQHLKLLRRAGLVEEERRGTRHYFSLHPAGLKALRTYLDSMWGDALKAFAQFVTEKEAAAKAGRGKKKGP